MFSSYLIVFLIVNPALSRCKKALTDICQSFSTWARGFEPPTFWSVAKRSIQLSYAHTRLPKQLVFDDSIIIPHLHLKIKSFFIF